MGSPIPLWDCWQSLGEKRQVLGITFLWSPSSVKSKAFGQILAHFTNDHYFPPSSSFLLLFCFFLLPLVTVMTSGYEFLLPLDTGQLIDCFTISYSSCHVLHQANPSVNLISFHSWYILITLPLPSPPQYTQMCIYLLTWDFFVLSEFSANWGWQMEYEYLQLKNELLLSTWNYYNIVNQLCCCCCC